MFVKSITKSLLMITCVCLSACTHVSLESGGPAVEPFNAGKLLQTENNRMTSLIMRSNLESLYFLLEKLYKRNPREWQKAGFKNRDEAIVHIKQAIQTRSPLFEAGDKKDIEILALSLDPNYTGDRVGLFIYGVAEMIITAHGGDIEFFVNDTLDSQPIYNAARNVEIAAWMLSTRKDSAGNLLVLSNDIHENQRNLSFEREFGKIIGRLDSVAILMGEKYERMGINYLHSILFLNFLPVK